MLDPAAFAELVSQVYRRATLLGSTIHGPEHWRSVAETGLKLIELGSPADPTVVLVFALVHDACRVTDERDPEHGPRAAELARVLREQGLLNLANTQFRMLLDACAGHTGGTITDDVTIGTCWDADRLQLWRCGYRPRPELLSTEQARREDVIAWAAKVHGSSRSWMELRDALFGGDRG